MCAIIYLNFQTLCGLHEFYLFMWRLLIRNAIINLNFYFKTNSILFHYLIKNVYFFFDIHFAIFLT